MRATDLAPRPAHSSRNATIREGRLLERRPPTGPNVGIFVGILTFHIGLSYCKITSNFNKVTAGAPANNFRHTQLLSDDRICRCHVILNVVPQLILNVRSRRVRKPVSVALAGCGEGSTLPISQFGLFQFRHAAVPASV